jgi:tyrosyl-tRNA synthetase
MTTTAPRQLPIEDQLAAICRGSDKVLPDEAALREKLQAATAARRPLRVKLGIDATVGDLHLGHTIPLRNLRRFQELGHTAILVIGDYTATVGDPSGRTKARPPLTHEQTRANAATFAEQAGKVLDLERAEVVYNSDWLSKLTFADLIRIGSSVSLKRMLEGDYFGRRLDDPSHTVYLHELFYPIMQGMDSVAIRADVELGGTDQEFNCLMGRDMQRLHDQEPQVVVASPLLLGLTGEEKMSKSLGNYVGVSQPPQEQFNRLMTMADARLPQYFRLLTELPMDEVERRLAAVELGHTDPREVKKELASAVVAQFHGPDAARDAAEGYERYAELRRTGGESAELPSDLRTVTVPTTGDGSRLTRVLVLAGLAASNGEAKRLIRQRGVKLRGEVVSDENATLAPGQAEGAVLLVGARPPVVLREEPHAG